ncbi:hypothetical protein [Streptomyces hiroshimensis]|uniref:Uncharacterized protein n=1 Tax=Streptomyces hiroshimensis TaxID=66424 RepID=A0ABQ2Z9E1_9ACTN|nr:hypothetical protein [Streptomyces hiroshimensis]GGY09269.1 hypothetical protein GCM10010324_65240 [Streptomyces hiroshimensis]
MYTLEMAYARMREMQDLANRSRAHQTAEHRAEAKAARGISRAARAKKR